MTTHRGRSDFFPGSEEAIDTRGPDSDVDAIKTLMISLIAHELNQPLTAAANNLAATRKLASNISDGHVLVEGLGRVQANLARIADTIRSMKGLLSDQQLERKRVSLKALVRSALMLTQEIIDVATSINIDPDAEWVEVAPIQIEQVLSNLIKNACAAMGEASEKNLVITASVGGEDHVVVRVRDTGRGFPEVGATAAADAKAEGHGFGLSISRALVENHHGHFWVEKSSPDGSIVAFTLPRAVPSGTLV